MGAIDQDKPTPGEWVLSGVALLLAAGAIVTMVLLALKANRDQKWVNWFGLTTAVGGALVYEWLKYAATIKQRHRDAYHRELLLIPARQEELRQLLEAVDRQRQTYAVLEAAIEVRALEKQFAQHRAELAQRAAALADEVDGLHAQERRLLDRKAAESQTIEAELAELLERLDIQRRKPSWFEWIIDVPLPLGLGTITRLSFDLIESYRERSPSKEDAKTGRDGTY